MNHLGTSTVQNEFVLNPIVMLELMGGLRTKLPLKAVGM